MSLIDFDYFPIAPNVERPRMVGPYYLKPGQFEARSTAYYTFEMALEKKYVDLRAELTGPQS